MCTQRGVNRDAQGPEHRYAGICSLDHLSSVRIGYQCPTDTGGLPGAAWAAWRSGRLTGPGLAGVCIEQGPLQRASLPLPAHSDKFPLQSGKGWAGPEFQVCRSVSPQLEWMPL